jgi:hypothetical protein
MGEGAAGEDGVVDWGGASVVVIEDVVETIAPATVQAPELMRHTRGEWVVACRVHAA